jgi:hypothetical protein
MEFKAKLCAAEPVGVQSEALCGRTGWSSKRSFVRPNRLEFKAKLCVAEPVGVQSEALCGRTSQSFELQQTRQNRLDRVLVATLLSYQTKNSVLSFPLSLFSYKADCKARRINTSLLNPSSATA